MSFTLPRLPQVLPTYPQVQIWWQQVVEKIEAQEAIQDQALLDIQDALDAALSRMPDVAPITINADHTGVALAGQLPRNVAFKRYYGSDDVTATTAWSMTALTGSISATIGAATGVIAITALGASSTVQVTSVRNGVTLTSVLTVTKAMAAAPSTGSGGGTSSSDSSFLTINSTAHVAISDELSVTAGSGGMVTLSAPLGVSTDEVSPVGDFKIYGKWQWDNGGVWADLAPEVSSSPDCSVTFDPDFASYFVTDGSISIPDSKTGLVAASTHKFRLMARKFSGARVMTLYGTASGVGS